MSSPEQLTRSLLAPPTTSVADRVRGEVRDRLLAGVVPRAEQLAPGAPLEINLALLRQVGSHPETVTRPDPAFAWKPVFVRRSLGLAVVQACVDGRFRTPADAAETVAAEAVEEWRRSGWRTYHWEPWFAGLAAGGRAAVVADAVTWATALWSTFDWREFDPAPRLGGADDQWVLPADRTIRLKGRAELRVPVRLGGSGSVGSDTPPLPEAMVSVTGGSPGDRWVEELAYLGLVAGLRSPWRPVPARVVGVWPDAGTTRMVAIDDASLIAAADLVVDTVATLVDARRVAAAAV
jgi:hypothetical protein